MLFEKDTTGKAVQIPGRNQSRQLKPIAEYISGKSGYFRSNLLGKRVDFTGRSIIVVGPHLKLDEFGLPKKMALEIFRPFVIGEILERELAYNVRGAQRLIDTETSVVWEMLEKVMQGKYMLLNRQPTLHRQSIQAFRPILTEGLAIELHPLVCSAFNADFDGDQMATYLPLSEEAQEEAKHILVSSNNIIKPASGEINATPATRDALLGCYWATTEERGAVGEGKYFSSVSEAITTYDFNAIALRAKIRVLASNKEKYGEYRGKMFETTVGRLLFNVKLPKEYPFVNETINKKKLNHITEDILEKFSKEVLTHHLDLIKDFGFKFASQSGITFSWDDLKQPDTRDEKIQKGFKKSKEIMNAYDEGLISLQERKRKKTILWQEIKAELTESIQEEIKSESSIANIIKSGARGSFDDLSNISGMLGIMDSASGEPIEQPVISSLKGGLNSIEYFCASFGTRKGLSDTALKTADSGFLSRKLFDVAQEVNVEGSDCGTTRGFRLYRHSASGAEDPFSERVHGRYTAEEITGDNDAVLIKKNQYITPAIAKSIEEHESIESVKIRSPITCQYAKGICTKCYGEDRTTGEIIDIGEPVGTVAAQSVGEPGTQLTMRTFHAGGVASIGGDITAGLPRVTEIFERRIPKAPAVIAHVNGVIEKIEVHHDGSHTIYLETGNKKATNADKNYSVSPSRFIEISVGDEVEKGQFLTDGSADLQEMLKYCGKEETQEYIFSEVTKIYELQGVGIAPVHFEIIIRQMFSRLIITDPGDANYTAGEMIELSELVQVNKQLEKNGKRVIQSEDIVTGISNVSISRNNFLSAASFQNTANVLIRAAISGARDTLDGVKENVIVGRLAPVGSGYEGSKKYEMVKKIREDIARRLAEKEEAQS